MRDKLAFVLRVVELDRAQADAAGTPWPGYSATALAERIAACGFSDRDAAEGGVQAAGAPLRYATVALRINGEPMTFLLEALAAAAPPPALTMSNLLAPGWSMADKMLYKIKLSDAFVSDLFIKVLQHMADQDNRMRVEEVDAVLRRNLLDVLVPTFARTLAAIPEAAAALQLTDAEALSDDSRLGVLRVLESAADNAALLQVVRGNPGAALNAALATLGVQRAVPEEEPVAEPDAAGGENAAPSLRRGAARRAKRGRTGPGAGASCHPLRERAHNEQDEPPAAQQEVAEQQEAAAAETARMAMYVSAADAALASRARRVLYALLRGRV